MPVPVTDDGSPTWFNANTMIPSWQCFNQIGYIFGEISYVNQVEYTS